MTQNRILIIESERKIAALLQRFLVRKNFDTFLASNGREALEAIHQASINERPFKTALIAASLGFEEAGEVCDVLEILPTVAIVMGHEDAVDELAKSHTVDLCLYKPYSAAEILAIVRQASSTNGVAPVVSKPIAALVEEPPMDATVRVEADSSVFSLAENEKISAPATVKPSVEVVQVEADSPIFSLDDDHQQPATVARLAPAGESHDLLVKDTHDDEDFIEKVSDEMFFVEEHSLVEHSLVEHSLVELMPLETPPPIATLPPPTLTPPPDPVEAEEFDGLLAPPDPFISETPAPIDAPFEDVDFQEPLPELIPSTPSAAPDRWKPGQSALEPDPQSVNLNEPRYRFRPMVPVLPHDPQGIYGEVTLAEIVYNCFRDLFSGQLLLRLGSVTKLVFIVNGRPVNTESNVRSEALGARLLAQGVITEAQHRASVAMMHQQGVRQGEAFVRMGLLTKTALESQLKEQVIARLINCFGWVGAEYGLTYDPNVAHRTDAFEVNPLLLIFEGIQAALPPAALLDHFDQKNRTQLKTTPKLSDYRRMLRDFEEALAVADLCDGQRSLGEVLGLSKLGLIGTLRVLRALEISGCISWGGLAKKRQAPQREERVSTEARTPQSSRRIAKSSSRPGVTSGATSKRRGASRKSKEPRGVRPSRTPSPMPEKAEKEADTSIREQVETLYGALEKQNYYVLLGIAQSATSDKIRAAYQKLAASVHPAHVERFGDKELHQKSVRVVQQLGVAYEVLRDTKKRSEYDLFQMPPPSTEGVHSDLIAAEESYARGRLCLAKGDFVRAVAYLEISSKQDPHQPLYQAYALWAKFRTINAKDRRARSGILDQLKTLVTKESIRDDGWTLLGDLYLKMGNTDGARKCFTKALSINRKNTQATRALDHLAQSSGKSDEGGLFGKLFSRR